MVRAAKTMKARGQLVVNRCYFSLRLLQENSSWCCWRVCGHSQEYKARVTVRQERTVGCGLAKPPAICRGAKGKSDSHEYSACQLLAQERTAGD
ncbi:hypothetical protein AVEN_84116-1 [Araneus ventricosus]|uniref:Uncharacterized protein n=1 Tax=Araneus ventricosus TaxID=182803 RepID=A0A4Y2RZ63_ARAVE|nr:hypothetical protein AVEN_84116-1 [Araneus ventricosus]